MSTVLATELRALLERLCAELGATLEPELDCSRLQTIAAELRIAERLPRLVEVSSSSLAHLTLPALVVMQDRAAVLRTLTRAYGVVEYADSTQARVPCEQLAPQIEGTALELSPSLSRKGRFATELFDFVVARPAELLKLALCAAMLAGLGLAPPLLTGLVFDRALPEQTPKLLSLLALTVLLLALSRALFSWLERRVALALHARLEAAVSSSLFDHLLRIPYAALARESVGAWIETLRSARSVQSLATETLLLPLLHLTMVLCYGVAIVQVHARIGLALGLGSLLLLLAALVFALRAGKLEQTLIDSSAAQHAGLYELLGGVLTLRTAGAEQRGVLRWLDRLLAARATSVRMDILMALSRLVLGGAREACACTTFLWAAHACLQHELSVGSVLALSMLADRFVSVVMELASVLAPLLTARTQLARVDTLLSHEDVTEGARIVLTDRDTHAARELPAVVMDDVWFRYGADQPWVLQGYSLSVLAGTRFELRGPSGMGKSTILRLIAGLYTPERGSVRVFGHAPRELRASIGYLPQDSHLFEGSILQNLRLLSGARDRELLAAAQRSGLAEFVQSLPMSYETVLSSGATNLSGGQRQLIVWTAAMASRRKLLLLDEALSHVDPLLRVRLLSMAGDSSRTTVAVEHERSGRTSERPQEFVGSAPQAEPVPFATEPHSSL